MELISQNSSSQTGLPQVRDFTDYRAFLKAFFDYKKSTRSGFSYRQFATLLGLKSPNYMQLVIQSKRNLTETTALRIAEKMKLLSNEAKFFVAMVRHENAETEKERTQAEKEKFVAYKKLISTECQQSQMLVMEEWWHLLVRECVTLKDFQPEGEWISEKLKGVISPAQAEQSLSLLLKSGLIEKKGKKFHVSESFFDTGIDQFPHSQMQMVHSDILKTWSKHLTKLDSKNQELGILNIPISAALIPDLKEKILQFQDEIIGWIESSNKAPTDIVQLGTYLIAYTDPDSNG